jgi:hypothetical protein
MGGRETSNGYFLFVLMRLPEFIFVGRYGSLHKHKTQPRAALHVDVSDSSHVIYSFPRGGFREFTGLSLWRMRVRCSGFCDQLIHQLLSFLLFLFLFLFCSWDLCYLQLPLKRYPYRRLFKIWVRSEPNLSKRVLENAWFYYWKRQSGFMKLNTDEYQSSFVSEVKREATVQLHHLQAWPVPTTVCQSLWDRSLVQPVYGRHAHEVTHQRLRP